MWDVEWGVFVIYDQELELETLDIYFITRLCHGGGLVQLYGAKPIDILLGEHCPEALKSKTNKDGIMTINYLLLKVLLLTTNRVVGA